jgi:arylsulfatase A-like enzyme
MPTRSLLLGVALSSGCAGSTPPDAPRDVVLVVIDTLRADHTSAHGYGRATTPTLQLLAHRGRVFERAYAQSSWTLASFSSLFTGLLPHQHRVARDDRDRARFGHLDPDVPTLAGTLRAHGLATAGFANNTFLAPGFGLQSGFDTYDYQGARQRDHRTASETVRTTLAWLDAHPEPGFAFVHFMEPHIDYAPPASTRGTYAVGPVPREFAQDAARTNPFFRMSQQQLKPDAQGRDFVQALYDEEVLAADQALGELVAGLVARDRMDSTLLVVTSDHGEEFWERGTFEHGRNLLSETTHIPLVVVGPGVPHGVVDVPVSHVDLFQGILAAVGATRPAGTQGEDLFSLGDHTEPGRAVLSENCLYANPCLSLVDRDHRWTLDMATGESAVWQVGDDLAEGRRLTGSDAISVADAMAAEALARRGDLEPLQALVGPRVPSFEEFEALAELGYIDPDQPSQQTPAPSAAEPPAPPASAE